MLLAVVIFIVAGVAAVERLGTGVVGSVCRGWKGSRPGTGMGWGRGRVCWEIGCLKGVYEYVLLEEWSRVG